MHKHFHIHFPRRVRDQAPGSVPGAKPPGDVTLLVQALLQAIAARQGGAPTVDVETRLAALRQRRTGDTGEWDETQHPRTNGGQFSSGQHVQAAQNHEKAAGAHAAAAKTSPDGGQGHQQAAELHQAASEAHTAAAGHIAAKTGLHVNAAKKAHEATYSAAQASGNLDKGSAFEAIKKVASDPSQPIGKRAMAVKQLEQYEEAAGSVAASPHAAVPMPAQPTSQAGPVGAKPTAASGPAKAATHALLSSGHPFSLEELMKATNVTNKATIMTALSDLKNPKYAGKLGALEITRRPDGMFHVAKAPAGGYTAVGAPNASASPAGANQPAAGGGAAPGVEAPTDPNAVVHGSHPLSDFMPGQKLTAKGAGGKQYQVLGHNAAGNVVVQGPNGKHNMEPTALKNAMVAGPGGKNDKADEAAAVNALEAHSGPLDDKTAEIAGSEAGEDQRRLNEHHAMQAKKGIGGATWAKGAPGAPKQSLATVAQGLMNKGVVKPGSTTPAPGTAPALKAKGLQSSKSAVVNAPPGAFGDRPGVKEWQNRLSSSLVPGGKKSAPPAPPAIAAPSNTRIQPDMNQKRLAVGSPALKRALAAKAAVNAPPADVSRHGPGFADFVKGMKGVLGEGPYVPPAKAAKKPPSVSQALAAYKPSNPNNLLGTKHAPAKPLPKRVAVGAKKPPGKA